MVVLVQTLVRSRLVYGLEAFFGAPVTEYKKMEVVECRALKMAMGLPQFTPNHLVYREAGLLPLVDEIRRRCANYAIRCQTVNNSTSVQDLAEPHHSHFHKSNLKITSMTEHIEPLIGEDGYEVDPKPPLPFPPWLTQPLEIILDMDDILKKDNPHVIGAKANEYIDTHFRNSIHIYTDGSLGPRGTGAAFFVPYTRYTRKYQLGDHSVFTAELVAIFMALHYIQAKGNTHPWTIFSDSKSVLTSIKHDSAKSREEMVRSAILLLYKLSKKNFQIKLQWVPSHVGVPGNTVADKLAKEAAEGNNSTLLNILPSYSDHVSRHKTKAWRLWQQQFAQIAQDRGMWDSCAPEKGGVRFGGVPLEVSRAMRRIRCGVWNGKFLGLECPCGAALTLPHVILECVRVQFPGGRPSSLRAATSVHPDRGWGDLQMVAETLMTSHIGLHL
jgi:ribonuclease HI